MQNIMWNSLKYQFNNYFDIAYSGDNCQTKVVGICDNTVCENGGQCQDLGTSFKCLCLVGFYGTK